MDNRFFTHPILNSPYAYPAQHWELDDKGQPTQQSIASRRIAKFMVPIPEAKKQKGKGVQQKLFVDHALTERGQQYDPSRSSTTCAARSTPGAAGPTRIPGRSPRKPLVCFSTGATIPFSPSAPFSARSRRWKPPSG